MYCIIWNSLHYRHTSMSMKQNSKPDESVHQYKLDERLKDEIFVHDVKTFSLTSDKVREIFEWFKLALNLWIDRPCVKYDQRANSKRSIFLKIHVMRDSSNSKTIWMDWWTKSIRIDFISCLLLLIHACTHNILHSGDMN